VFPEFLNNREDATLLWALVVLGFVLYKDFRGITRSLLGVLRALEHRKLRLLFGSALLYSAALVYAASELGLWHVTALKATIYWFLGTAVALAGAAVTEGARSERAFLRKVIRRAVAVTVVTEFVVNVYALPFAIEVVCVFVLFVFVAMQAVVTHDTSTPHATRALIDAVLAAVGVLYVGYFVIRVLNDFDGFLSREHAEEFLVGPALTLALIPLLLVAAWVSRQEQRNLRKRFCVPLAGTHLGERPHA
jgi:hypothetical protein